MRVEVPVEALFGFLLLLARVAGVCTFVPIPGWRAAGPAPRVVLALALASALAAGRGAAALPGVPGVGAVLGWIASEAALGLMLGLAVAFVAEGFGVAMQVLGLQAGYSYASTIDPTSEADSSILQILGQLMANLLLFVTGLHREVIRIFAASFDVLPAGAFVARPEAAGVLIGLGGQAFVLGLRLALPVVALLLLVDLSLALVGRIHAQLQLLTLAFPMKMLAALAFLTALLAVMPSLYEESAQRSIRAMQTLVSR